METKNRGGGGGRTTGKQFSKGTYSRACPEFIHHKDKGVFLTLTC